jgi:hypothetical protein
MKAEHATTTRQEHQIIQRNAAAQRAQQSQASQASGADLFAQMLQDNLDPGKDAATQDALTAQTDAPLLEDPALAGLLPPQARDARKSAEDPANAANLFNPLAGLQIGHPSEAITTEDQAVNAALARAHDTVSGQPTGKGLANRADKGGKPQNPNAALSATRATPASADDALGKATPATPATPSAQSLQPSAQALQGASNGESAGTHRTGSNVESSESSPAQTFAVVASAGSAPRGDSNTPSNGSGSDLGTGAASSQDNNASAASGPDAVPVESFADRMDQAMQEAFESLGAQVSVWASQNTKRAAMRLDAGLRNPLEVDVTLKDRQAHIHFRTDDAQARETIRAQAQTILSDLLARQGMDLGSVSVGAQGGDANGRSSGQPESSQGWRGLHRALDRVSGSEASEQAVQIRPRSQRALDLYA